MLKALFVVTVMTTAIGVATFSFIQPQLKWVHAKVFHVDLTMNAASFGGDSMIQTNITIIGEASMNQFEVGRLESTPPFYNYLRIVSNNTSYYATVFWSSSFNSGQKACFNRLIIPVSASNESVTFYYQGSNGKEISLGTY